MRPFGTILAIICILAPADRFVENRKDLKNDEKTLVEGVLEIATAIKNLKKNNEDRLAFEERLKLIETSTRDMKMSIDSLTMSIKGLTDRVNNMEKKIEIQANHVGDIRTILFQKIGVIISTPAEDEPSPPVESDAESDKSVQTIAVVSKDTKKVPFVNLDEEDEPLPSPPEKKPFVANL